MKEEDTFMTFWAIVLIALAMTAAFFYGRATKKAPAVETPVFDEEKARVIAASLNGASPEKYEDLGQFMATTLSAFGIPSTAKEGCAERIAELREANIDAENEHRTLEIENREKIQQLMEEIEASKLEMDDLIAENDLAASEYGKALKVFFKS